MGFKDDAIQKLAKLAEAHTELPTLCLWLGDMYELSEQTEEAMKWWKLAVAHDHLNGAVALAARRQLNRSVRTSNGL
jgi:hypothetical protein